MRAYALTHLSDAVLLCDLTTLVARDRSTTAVLLAHLAEVDERRLYVPAGYPSMHAYCVDQLHMSEDAAYKRIQAARAARRFPVLLTALAEGRLHLAAVCLLAPHLTPENLEELLAAATHRRKSEIERWLAERLPRPELPAMAIPPLANQQLAPGQVDMPEAVRDAVGELVPDQVEAPAARPEPAPPSAKRFALPPVGRGTYDKLRYAQALLSHAIPSGDVAQVLDRALDALIEKTEKRRFAATNRPRAGRGSTSNTRHVPAHVRRAVWERDQGQCTFVGEAGHRCSSRRFLEFDHVDPVARGGRASMAGVRLRCRAHNQYAAERIFGAGFMKEKRAEAQRAKEARRATADQQAQDVFVGLRTLGFRADEARRAVECSATPDDAALEERMRAALRFLGRRPVSTTPMTASP
jgi:hypothetical protein